MKASNTRALGTFGWAVAISGDVIAVGAPAENSSAVGVGGNQADTSAAGAGAVYVFRYSDAWVQEAYVKASNTTSYDNFGWSLGLRGEVLVVGAYAEDSNSVGVNNGEDNDAADDSGAIYVLRRGTSTWSQQAYIKASNTGSGDHFGEAVAVSDDTIAVGARYEDGGASGINGPGSNTKMDSGAAYVFH
jgi:hypothetical protein